MKHAKYFGEDCACYDPTKSVNANAVGGDKSGYCSCEYWWADTATGRCADCCGAKPGGYSESDMKDISKTDAAKLCPTVIYDKLNAAWKGTGCTVNLPPLEDAPTVDYALDIFKEKGGWEALVAGGGWPVFDNMKDYCDQAKVKDASQTQYCGIPSACKRYVYDPGAGTRQKTASNHCPPSHSPYNGNGIPGGYCCDTQNGATITGIGFDAADATGHYEYEACSGGEGETLECGDPPCRDQNMYESCYGKLDETCDIVGQFCAVAGTGYATDFCCIDKNWVAVADKATCAIAQPGLNCSTSWTQGPGTLNFGSVQGSGWTYPTAWQGCGKTFSVQADCLNRCGDCNPGGVCAADKCYFKDSDFEFCELQSELKQFFY
jgi:hypothetical protein